MHESVLVREMIESLQIKDNGFYFDGTVGMGGHSRAILAQAQSVRVVGVDRDAEALKYLKLRSKKDLNKSLFLFHGNFKDILTLKDTFPEQEFDGALLDLGFSSFQIDTAQRGFSFRQEGPLDMRMDGSQTLTAKEIVNSWSEEQLVEIFKAYGEEPHSKKIAYLICKKRIEAPFKTTIELANLISKKSPLWTRARIHPATRVFQALRIAVNEELEGLSQALENVLACLKKGSRLGVISFHSLEDRIVKQSFYRFENPCECPKDFPKCACHKKPLGKRITKKIIIPKQDEILKNPRSRSAKLRVFEKE